MAAASTPDNETIPEPVEGAALNFRKEDSEVDPAS